MIYLELSDEEMVYSTELPEMNVNDILHTLEEMVRVYTDLDVNVDNYILKRAEEIQLRQLN